MGSNMKSVAKVNENGSLLKRLDIIIQRKVIWSSDYL